MPIARAARATSSSNRPACAAYKEFEARVGTIASARGAKRELVRRAIAVLPPRFTVADLRRACAGVSYPSLQRALADLRREKNIRCLGRGPHAQWERIAELM